LQAENSDLVEPLRKTSAIFMTGGNQLKLSSLITGTPFGDAIADAHERGIGAVSRRPALQQPTIQPLTILMRHDRDHVARPGFD
jgi:hypothetical protein